MTQESIKAYKSTKECNDERIKYSAMTYHIQKNEVQSKVAIRFPSLDLTILDVDSDEENDESTPEPMAGANPPAATNKLAQAKKYARMKNVFVQEAPATFLVGGEKLRVGPGYCLRQERSQQCSRSPPRRHKHRTPRNRRPWSPHRGMCNSTMKVQ